MPRTTVGMVLALTALGVGCAAVPEVSGLRPLSPAADGRVATVDTAWPRLRWEAFPRPKDEAAFGPDAARRISDVTFDVRLWRGGYGRDPAFDDGQVPVATGLVHPSYTTAKPLAPGVYYWTVRARFRLDGQPRATQWSQLVRGRGRWEEVGYWNALSFVVKG